MLRSPATTGGNQYMMRTSPRLPFTAFLLSLFAVLFLSSTPARAAIPVVSVKASRATTGNDILNVDLSVSPGAAGYAVYLAAGQTLDEDVYFTFVGYFSGPTIRTYFGVYEGQHYIFAKVVDENGHASKVAYCRVKSTIPGSLVIDVDGEGVVKGIPKNGFLAEHFYRLTAVPSNGNIFGYWEINGKQVWTPTVTLSGSETGDIQVRFVPNPYSDIAGNYNTVLCGGARTDYDPSLGYTTTGWEQIGRIRVHVGNNGSYSGVVALFRTNLVFSGKLSYVSPTEAVGYEHFVMNDRKNAGNKPVDVNLKLSFDFLGGIMSAFLTESFADVNTSTSSVIVTPGACARIGVGFNLEGVTSFPAQYNFYTYKYDFDEPTESGIGTISIRTNGLVTIQMYSPGEKRIVTSTSFMDLSGTIPLYVTFPSGKSLGGSTIIWGMGSEWGGLKIVRVTSPNPVPEIPFDTYMVTSLFQRQDLVDPLTAGMLKISGFPLNTNALVNWNPASWMFTFPNGTFNEMNLPIDQDTGWIKGSYVPDLSAREDITAIFLPYLRKVVGFSSNGLRTQRLTIDWYD